MEIQKKLLLLQDKTYAEFQRKLTPGIAAERFIGVRVPELRKLAKQYMKEAECALFLQELPHQYYDEDMLHGILISELKDYDGCIRAVDAFLPSVDNWAVCDIMSPKIFRRNKEQLIGKIREWSASDRTYTCRFGLEMLMSHFLDDDFKPEYLEIPAAVRSEEYYVNMMIAWFFATALAKQWNSSVQYITEKRLAPWVHNKTIQKAKESYRITAEQKAFLSGLKV